MHIHRIPLGIKEICIWFLEVELLCEILGPKYNKIIEKFKEQNLSLIFHMISEKY